MKNQKPIDVQIQSAEQELAALDEKRKELQARKVVIYDYLDFDVPVLARMYDRRVKGYRSIGYEIEEFWMLFKPKRCENQV